MPWKNGLENLINRFDPIDQIIEQALIESFARQATRTPIPVLVVTLVIAAISFPGVPFGLLVAWVVAVTAIQALRWHVIGQLPTAISHSPCERVAASIQLNFLNGAVFGSIALGFPYLDEVLRTLITMIMIGMAAGAIATTTGFRPAFLAFLLPQMAGVSLGWLLAERNSMPWLPFAVILLLVMLGNILYSIARDTFNAFTRGYQINAELTRALGAEKLANTAKTRFLASASHDLRQPLHTLSLLAAALTLRPLDDKSASIANSMNEAMSHLASELDSLLDISKLDAGIVKVVPKHFSVSEAIQLIASAYTPLINKKNLRLDVSTKGDPSVFTDRYLFDRVIRNLVDNAIKYTESGSIRIETSIADGMVKISVSDTGSGIDSDELRHIFEEFYQVGNRERDRRKGLGLGLSIVNRLVRLLDGKLTVISTLGVGSTFQFFLTDHGPSEETVNVGNYRFPDLQDVRVLLVEDDAGVRLATRTLLEEFGCRVEEAAGTAEALQIANTVVLDIALIDLRLPDDDGFVAIDALRGQATTLPIIVISGETSAIRLREVAELGLTHLVKPVSQEVLLAEMGRTLSAAPKSNQPTHNI